MSTPVVTTSANATAASVDPSTLSTAELQQHVERCARLMKHAALLDRLPDHGAGIKERHLRFTEELAARASRKAETPSTETSAEEGPSSSSAKRANEEDALRAELSSAATRLAAQAAVMKKYEDHRVSVEANVRRMYEGTLSEREIQRVIDEVPPTFFLTYRETQEMAKESAKQARRDELQRLRAQTASYRPSTATNNETPSAASPASV